MYRSDGSCNLTPAGNGITSDDVKNVVQHNVANQNVGDGIHVDSPITRIGKNTTNSNGDLGIEAVPGVVDGGGNRAFGNGNPLQCLNIFCKTNGRGK